jgi:hypothetical protein
LTDSERFYNSILELLEDPEEKEEIEVLLQWWNRYVSIISRILALTLPQTDFSDEWSKLSIAF